MSFEKIKSVLFAAAERAGLEDFDVFYRTATDISADALNREPSAFSFGKAGGVCFRCALKGKIGSASTECLDEAELEALIPRAMANAKEVDVDEDPIFYAPSSSDSYGTVTAEKPRLPDAATLGKAAIGLQERIYAASPLVTDGTETSVGAAEITISLANSKGLMLTHTAAARVAYAEAVLNDKGEPSYGTALTANEDVLGSGIAERAVEEALARLGGKSVKTGKYRVVLSAKMVRSLLSAYSGIFSGKNALLGLSLLKGKEGTEIASKELTIFDDPFYPENTMQMPFDAEGVPTYKKALIERGVLKTLLYDLTTAKKAGVQSTGNAGRGSYADPVSVTGFCRHVAAGDATLDELFAQMENGIYITELKGMHAGCDAVTGDFSLESAGFLVKNGEKKGAVKGFTVAGNFFELLKNIERIGCEVELGSCSFSAIAAPAILVRDISVAGEE